MLEKRCVLLENIGIVPLITFVSLQTIFVASRKCFVRLLNEDNRCIDISNARQDIRHLRIRCDTERLAPMGRAEPEDCRSPFHSDRQTSGLFKLAPLDNTVAVSRLQPFSASLRKPEDSTFLCPTAPQGP